MQNLDAYYMSIRLEAEIAACRAEQRARHAEFTPTRRHALLVRLATALAPVGLLFGLPVH